MQNVKMRGPTKDAFMNILDTFTGADGGGNFVLFQEMMVVVDKQAAEGDKPSQEVLQVMLRFSKLIDIATGNRIPRKPLK